VENAGILQQKQQEQRTYAYLGGIMAHCCLLSVCHSPLFALRFIYSKAQQFPKSLFSIHTLLCLFIYLAFS